LCQFALLVLTRRIQSSITHMINKSTNKSTSYVVQSEYDETKKTVSVVNDTIILNDGSSISIQPSDEHSSAFEVTIGGIKNTVIAKPTSAGVVKLHVNGYSYDYVVREQRIAQYERIIASSEAMANASTRITAPMPGLVKQIFVHDGQLIKKGESLVVLEAMKMENLIKAPTNGTIRKTSVQAGTTVEKGVLFCVIEPS
jgi:biotin carboxyl carrier protein